MSGVFEFLDNLATGVTNVAGRAVDAAGNIAVAQANAQSAARVPDQSSAAPAATLSAGLNVGGSTMLWIGVIGLVGVGLFLALRR